MCRIFGFRSVIQSQVHSSLVQADNALLHQSNHHPDGWGVAYYVGQSPHIVKSLSPAFDDHLFKRVSGIVASETVIAHLRKATIGETCVTNTHPFQYGRWVFAHNGNIKNFPQLRKILMARIDSNLRRFVLGETDSEAIFYLLLTHLGKLVDIHQEKINVDDLVRGTQNCLTELKSVVGPFNPDDKGDPKDTYFTFIITNGTTLLAHQGGKALSYSTYKTRCPDRGTCRSFAPECEAPTQTGFVNHLVFSSEPLQGENIWVSMPPGQMIGLDWKMKCVIVNPKP